MESSLSSESAVTQEITPPSTSSNRVMRHHNTQISNESIYQEIYDFWKKNGIKRYRVSKVDIELSKERQNLN